MAITFVGEFQMSNHDSSDANNCTKSEKAIKNNAERLFSECVNNTRHYCLKIINKILNNLKTRRYIK